ncbi:MAG: glycerol-3-phosphate acyltransferase [Dehalococcoidia bacterium]
MLWQVTLLIVGAYLIGSVPTAYIAGRTLKGIDVRGYGSGSVSGSNVWQSVSHWAILPVGIADISKGVIPVLIAQVLGFALAAQGIVGLAAIAGHNWSIFLRFSGGRGIATMMGVLAILAPWELLVFIGVFLLGIALFNVPVGAFIAAVALPLAGLGFGEPLPLTLSLLAMTLLLIAKRLTANRGALIGDWRRVLVYRLLLDRDVPEREAWIHRTPPDLGNSTEEMEEAKGK